MASVRPKHVVSNFFISWFLIITSIRKLLVVLLTASPYRHLDNTIELFCEFFHDSLSAAVSMIFGKIWQKDYQEGSGVNRFSKNQGATSKFQVLAGWHESSSFLRNPWFWNDSGAFCLWCVNLYTILYVGKKSVIIMLKILVTAIQNLVAWATRYLGFVDSSYLVWKVVQWGSHRQLWGTVLVLHCGCRDRIFRTVIVIASCMSVTFFN